MAIELQTLIPVVAYLLADGTRASSITLPNQTIHYRGTSYRCLWDTCGPTSRGTRSLERGRC